MTTECGDKKTEDPEKRERDKLRELASKVTSFRKKPLLVMFYHTTGSIHQSHIEILHKALNDGGLHIAEPLMDLDVLIHTLGGDPVGAYRLAQVIRDFTKGIVFLVPEYAYSGGTLICLSGNTIPLGNHAVLSPIDITRTRVVEREGIEYPLYPEEQEQETAIELVAIDHFIKVATQSRIEIESEFRRRKMKLAHSEVEQAMLCKMVEQMGVIEVAKVFREKNISQAYASELLRCYMFVGERNSQIIERILRRLVAEAPAHEFSMDYHICKDVGLKVEEMQEDLSDYCNDFLKQLKKMARDRLICEPIRGTPNSFPFFQYFPYPEIANTTLLEVKTEVSDGEPKGDGGKEQREKTNISQK